MSQLDKLQTVGTRFPRFGGLLVVALALAAQPAQVSRGDIETHRIGRIEPIRVPGVKAFQSVTVEANVDTSGAVVSTKATSGPEEARDRAVARVKALHYRPFLVQGKPASVQFIEYVQLLPQEILPTKHVPFPDVKDWNSVQITLQRSACFGMCPAYKVEIAGDGKVVYEGGTNVGAEGKRQGAASVADVKQLVEQFRKADFFSLEDHYSVMVTDMPTNIISISIGGSTKSVSDYVGQYAGMPQAVTELEDAIDRVAGTEKWIKRP